MVSLNTEVLSPDIILLRFPRHLLKWLVEGGLVICTSAFVIQRNGDSGNHVNGYDDEFHDQSHDQIDFPFAVRC